MNPRRSGSASDRLPQHVDLRDGDVLAERRWRIAVAASSLSLALALRGETFLPPGSAMLFLR